MPRIRSIMQEYGPWTEFLIMQGAYRQWCCAAAPENAVMDVGNVGNEIFHQSRKFFANDPPHEFSLPDSGFVSLASAPNVQFIVDSVTEDWSKFQNLVGQWREQRGARSSITETAMLSAYQKIIGMGEAAVPLILAQLRSEGDDPDQWFWALRAITGENPVKPEDQGNFQKMAQAWLHWAEREVYAW